MNATELQCMHLLQYRNKVGVVSQDRRAGVIVARYADVFGVALQDTQLFRMTVTERRE